MSVTFIKQAGERRERPSLAPPLEFRWPIERYRQYLNAPRMPRPSGEGWRKVGRITRDKTWVTVWCEQRRAYVFGPCNLRVQHWVCDRVA
jgi:hypothetical protein